MAAVEVSPIEVIRDQHWIELAEYLGIKPAKAKAQLELWFRLLREMGYALTPTGTNRAAGRPARAPESAPPAPAPVFEHSQIYAAVEGALIDLVSRREAGERISDQAEIRAIVGAVMACISAPGSDG
jgi:hypothetical protein